MIYTELFSLTPYLRPRRKECRFSGTTTVRCVRPCARVITRAKMWHRYKYGQIVLKVYPTPKTLGADQTGPGQEVLKAIGGYCTPTTNQPIHEGVLIAVGGWASSKLPNASSSSM